jgi:hypothetical protein
MGSEPHRQQKHESFDFTGMLLHLTITLPQATFKRAEQTALSLIVQRARMVKYSLREVVSDAVKGCQKTSS